MTQPNMEVIGVYHANGGILGELAYVTGKILGLTSCALCDLSHGLIFEKKSVKSWRCSAPFSMRFLHLNEVDSLTSDIVRGCTPCVVLRRNDCVSLLISKEELAEMSGDESALFARIEAVVNDG
mgnify:CR=1 FL=1